MSRTNDSLFHKEFRDMMNGRRSLAVNFDIRKLPLPELNTIGKGAPKRKMALVRGVKEQFFERLNKSEVQLVGRTTLRKRQVLPDGTFRKDKEGNYEFKDVPVSHGCVAVLSSISIGLKRTVDGKVHTVSEGYRYVDYVETKQGRKYIYILPKEFVYRLNMCALVLTPNKRRSYFHGFKLALQSGTYVYLYAIPYTYREQMDACVLGVKSGFDFTQETNAIIRHWMNMGVIFNLTVTALEGQVNGETNVGFSELEGTIVSEDYKRFGESMATEKEDVLSDSI